MTFPNASTRLCGVIGHPVAHSMSPAIHNAALRHDGRNAIYVAFDVEPSRLEAAIEGLVAVGASGVNVTLPHKRAAWSMAAGYGEEAEATDSANVLVFGPDGILAHNTDVAGISRALEDLGAVVAGARCLVVGAGGAGRAAVLALTRAGAGEIVVCNRTRERAEHAAAVGQGAVVADWSGLEEAVCSCEVLVEATSVGLAASDAVVGSATLERAALAGLRVVLDLVYAPGETALVHAAREAGIVAADGLGVLVHQAADAYRHFWGAEPPVRVMREAAEQAAGRRRRSDREEEPPPIA